MRTLARMGIFGSPRSLPPPPSFLQILPPWSVPTEAIHQGAEGNASSSDTSSPAAYCPSASCATALPIDQSRLLKRFLFPISFPLFFWADYRPPPPTFVSRKIPQKAKRPFARRRISGGHPNLCCSRCPRRGKPRKFGHPSKGEQFTAITAACIPITSLGKRVGGAEWPWFSSDLAQSGSPRERGEFRNREKEHL